MSVDEMIRTGLEEGALAHSPGPNRLDTVVTLGRRRLVRRRLAVGAAVLATALAVGVGTTVGGSSPQATVPASTPRPDPLAQLAEDARLSEALVGSWSTAVVDEADVVLTLGRHRMAQHLAVVLGEMPLPTRVGITFDERRYTTRFADEVTDLGTWHVKDGRLVLVPSCALCRVVLLPALEDDTLRLTLLEDPSPDHLGIPDAVFGVAVYTTAPFDRVAS